MDGEPRVRRRGHFRELYPWLTEFAFVAGVLVTALVVFLVLTSGQNPFATALVPIIIVLAVVAAAVRYRWLRRHQADASFVHSRRSERERRGF